MNSEKTENITFTIRKMTEADLKWVCEWYASLPYPDDSDLAPRDLPKLLHQQARYVVLSTKIQPRVGIFCVNESQGNMVPVKFRFFDRQYATNDNRIVLAQTIKLWMQENYPKIVPEVRFV